MPSTDATAEPNELAGPPSRAEPTTRELTRELVRLALPAIGTSLLQTTVFLTDRLCLARYSEDALASMQVQGTLLWTVYGVFTGLLVGTVPLVARAVGAGDTASAATTARIALRLALALGVLVTSLGLAALEPLLGWLGSESLAIRQLSRQYLQIAWFGVPAMFLATTAAFVLNASGDTRTPLRAGLVSNLVNIVLAIGLVFGVSLGPLQVPALGVRGAAIGTVIAFSVEALLLLRALTDPSARVRVTGLWRPGVRAPAARRQLLRVSLPALLERVVIHGGYLSYSAVIALLGPLVMASNQALVTIESICFMSADGFGVAAATLVGQSLGRGTPRAAMRAGWTAALACAVTLSALGLVLWATGGLTSRWFVPEGADGEALVAATRSGLPLLALAQPFMAFGVVLAQSLRGAGDTRSPVVSALLGGLLLRVGLAAWLGLGLGLGVRAVWLASCADWALRTLLLGVIFQRGRWRGALGAAG